MKKITLILFSLLLLIFSGCNSEQEIEAPTFLDCGEYAHGESFKDDCNTCTCSDGKELCTQMACNKDINSSFKFDEFLDDIKFNQDLTTFEQEWLGYLEIKFPESKIYHMRTQTFNCEDCYEISYKKDREVIKIKVLNGDKSAEKTVTDDIVLEIENTDICQLFQGTWNECPKLCPTDEEICMTQCGAPICEFDYNLIIYKKVDEECGGIDKGDCEYGLSCIYKSREDEYGTCEER